MSNQISRKNKRLRKLIVGSVICAIVLTVSTYAWFIGMKTVNVSKFDVEIATTEGLWISMDGVNWGYNLDAKNTAAYATNTNTWANTGLIPISTVGELDSKSSRLKLFEKGSFTSTPGGYRLLTSRVDNYLTTESGTNQGKGYVAFDLFIKNLSGEEYYKTNEPLNEEAIYLTTNSEVTVATNGVSNTGIENSVRVAFAQIGRVVATETNQTTITGMTCDTKGDVTGICRTAQIWEPNDTNHVQNAIKWYNTSCLQRLTAGTTVTDPTSYSTNKCKTVTNETANSTYAISRVINIADNVNIYDGEQFNGYKTNTTGYDTFFNTASASRGTYKLVDVDYFTDTEKDMKSVNRPTFMTLAPNSITKVRVYVFIEGQDVDNYDFASLGKQISVKFGFTKERYTEGDVGYTGPTTNITPTEEGIITNETTAE